MGRKVEIKDWRELRGKHFSDGHVRTMSFTEKAYGKNTASVYVISKEDVEVKIGVSKNVGSRSLGLQTSNSAGLCVFWAIRLNRADAFRLETYVHQNLRKTLSHIRGEWYMMGPETAVEVIKKAIKKLQLKTETDLLFGYGETA